MYGKVFDTIYDGTLYGHWEAIVTMQQLIVLATPDGVVDMTPQAISARTSIPFEIIEKGLTRLEAPDPEARYSFQRAGHVTRRNPVGWAIAGFEEMVWEGRLSPWRWSWIRQVVFERDSYRCQYCGKDNVTLEPDHIHPVSRGGSNNLNNLVAACVPCNRSKGAKMLSEWRI